jgi:hypothetical protein
VVRPSAFSHDRCVLLTWWCEGGARVSWRGVSKLRISWNQLWRAARGLQLQS